MSPPLAALMLLPLRALYAGHQTTYLRTNQIRPISSIYLEKAYPEMESSISSPFAILTNVDFDEKFASSDGFQFQQSILISAQLSCLSINTFFC